MKGNEALAEAAIQAGCRHYFGYPITPQNEITAYMSKRMPKVDGVFIQAESEIAAINMTMGAVATGVRAMTSSSSPGISLKTETISYMAACDLPALIVNIQRGGPGLGGIQPSQADYFQATRALGHGDLRVLVLAPSTVQEMVDLVYDAFDLAEQYRIPAMILADGLLGQMMEPVTITRAVNPEDLPEQEWAASGHKNKRAKNVVNSLKLEPEELEKMVAGRFERYKQIESAETKAEDYMTDDAEIVLVAYGASARIAKTAVSSARKMGIKAGVLRPITLWPFPSNSIRRLNSAKCFLTVEMSMGQMVEDVRAAIEYSKPVHFYGRTGGIIPEQNEILQEIIKLAGGE